MDQCPCGSQKDYSLCCMPFHKGSAIAPTALALMKSRYSAYVKQEITYLMDTVVQQETEKTDPEATRKWAAQSTWKGLEILSTQAGGLTDSTGVVEFIAKFETKGVLDQHHEKAKFVKANGKWLYENGDLVPTTRMRQGEKVGRNDPCHCGSGKKFKHCHGA